MPAVLKTILKEELFKKLESYGKIKLSGNSFKVLLDDGSSAARIDFLKKLTEAFSEYDAKIMIDNPNFSSVGYVKINNFRVAGKPAKRQGMGSAGLGNEKIFIDSINKAIRDTGGSIDICLVGKNNVKFTAVNVYEAKEMGRTTAGGAKSDVDLVGENTYKISLKQDNAEIWESADSRYGSFIKKKLDSAEKRGKILFEPVMEPSGKSQKKNQGKPVVRLVPESKIEIPLAEQKSVVFGSDIKKGEGAIVKKTFSLSDFVYENNCLYINCSKVFNNITDVIRAGEKPTILLRNDSTRNSRALGIAGIRIIVSIENSRVKKAQSI